MLEQAKANTIGEQLLKRAEEIINTRWGRAIFYFSDFSTIMRQYRQSGQFIQCGLDNPIDVVKQQLTEFVLTKWSVINWLAFPWRRSDAAVSFVNLPAKYVRRFDQYSFKKISTLDDAAVLNMLPGLAQGAALLDSSNALITSKLNTLLTLPLVTLYMKNETLRSDAQCFDKWLYSIPE